MITFDKPQRMRAAFENGIILITEAPDDPALKEIRDSWPSIYYMLPEWTQGNVTGQTLPDSLEPAVYDRYFKLCRLLCYAPDTTDQQIALAKGLAELCDAHTADDWLVRAQEYVRLIFPILEAELGGHITWDMPPRI